MWSRYHEPLSLADMADTAILSKFYFSRVFRTLTGTSPGRFLTAIRLTKAKQLLLETSLSVTEISYMVGYNSLGTFTSRFTRSVGMPPARYRALSHGGILAPSSFPGAACATQAGSVAGWVEVPETGTSVRVYVGAFKDPIAQGVPVACAIREGAGPYRLETVPEGRFYLRAAVVAVDDLDPNPSKRRPLFVGAEASSVRAGRTAEAHIETRPASPLDLPILLALPELDARTAPDVRLAVPSPR
ncbi:helix-turn-helix transcriptional regulator [Saccharothrix carnea]|nr:helix-turn-helix transcriptional regulator [Saccharothrix carnea]